MATIHFDFSGLNDLERERERGGLRPEALSLEGPSLFDMPLHTLSS